MVSSDDAVVLTAPDPRSAATYWIDVLGYRCTATTPSRVVLEGPGSGPRLEIHRGSGGDGQWPGSRDAAELEVRVALQRMETAWERDRARNSTVPPPVGGKDGTLVYLTCDSTGHGLALVVDLAAPDDRRSERITRRIKAVEQ